MLKYLNINFNYKFLISFIIFNFLFKEILSISGTDSEIFFKEEQESSNSGIDAINPFKRKSKIVSIPQPQQIKMKIAKPTNFDQVDEIINQLKDKNAVVINLEYVSKEIARRIIDVISGATKALDGHIEKVSNSIFVVAPLNYDIINENAKEKIESKFSASWIK